jgi:hypothetical protein
MLSEETRIQIAVMEWLKLQYPDIERWAFHVANERKTSISYGSLLKRMGVKAGVPDLFIMEPVAPYHGLVIELKTEKGKKSLKQIEFVTAMQAKGYYSCFCFGFDEAISTITNYLKGKL